MDINELEQILSLLKRNDIVEFELHQGETHLKLSRGGQVVMSAATPVAQTHIAPAIVSAHSNGVAVPGETPDEIDPKLFKVESPIVGTFYRKPAPDAEPFVKEGDAVKKGDTLCIVEAMKLMNEIEAPISGKVMKSLLSDGEVVEFGEVLFLINPE